MSDSAVEWISFDCYGTLVDWESGITAAVEEVLERHGARRSRAEILALYSEIEPTLQTAQMYLPYRQVLHEVMAAIATQVGFECTDADLDCLARSLPEWPIFPDVAGTLSALKTRYKLAVISNVDDDLFAGTAAALNVDFDAVVTGEQAGSYKPSLHNFRMAQERMAVRKDAWLHVAESLYHDIAPANQLGIRCVWVDRADRGGGTRRTDAVPDLVVPDLTALARRMMDRPAAV